MIIGFYAGYLYMIYRLGILARLYVNIKKIRIYSRNRLKNVLNDVVIVFTRVQRGVQKRAKWSECEHPRSLFIKKIFLVNYAKRIRWVHLVVSLIGGA